MCIAPRWLKRCKRVLQREGLKKLLPRSRCDLERERLEKIQPSLRGNCPSFIEAMIPFPKKTWERGNCPATTTHGLGPWRQSTGPREWLASADILLVPLHRASCPFHKVATVGTLYAGTRRVSSYLHDRGSNCCVGRCARHCFHQHPHPLACFISRHDN
jgi:hypothetical protein